MHKKILLLVLSLSLMLAMIPIASVGAGVVPRQNEIAVGTIGEPETVDPGWLYDTASAELVWNVYDTLLSFYVNRTGDPYGNGTISWGKATLFEASLAYDWTYNTSNPDHPVYTFKIRGTHDHFITVQAQTLFLPDPTGSIWMETPSSEMPGRHWTVWNWEDNNIDGVLSPCDVIKMYMMDLYEGPFEMPWLAFHVQSLDGTGIGATMELKELPVPFQILRTLTLPGGFSPTHPEGALLTETDPVSGRGYTLVEWEDGMFGAFSGAVSKGDVITLTRTDTPPVNFSAAIWTRDYIVESIDLVGGHIVVKPCLTPYDVEYTMERWFVLDHYGGPQWMIYEALTYPDYSWNFTDPTFASRVDAAIEVVGRTVEFTLAIPYSQSILSQVLAQSWASIMYTDWAIDQGCWDGNYANVATYHDPEVSPLMDPVPVMCGTGPYYYVEWITGKHWRIERFLEHWRQWPIPGTNGYVDVVREEFISSWPTRKLMFLAGDLDFCYVPRMYMGDVWEMPGIRCDYPVLDQIVDGVFFNLNISSKSRYLYPPFIEHLDYGVFKDTGIPPDFFNDTYLRKAFLYCINFTEFQDLAYLGESVYPVTPNPYGPDFGWCRHPDEWYTENAPNLNLTKAEYYFKMAWGGGPANDGEDPTLVTSPGLVWTNGFKLPLTYNTGNVPRKTICEDYIEVNVEGLNAKFHVDVYDVEWGTVYIPELFRNRLTMFIIGWIPDYLDPHNYFFTFMGSGGSFSGPQKYSDPYVDKLIDTGMKMKENNAARAAVYQELEEIYVRDVPSICSDQPTGRHWERDWMYGWYYNPIYPGYYFAHYWKDVPPGVAELKPVDVSALDSISPPVGGSYVVVGLKGYMKPQLEITVDAKVTTANPGVPGFFVVLGFTRTLTSEGIWEVIDMDYLWMLGGAGSTVDATFTWNEVIDSGLYNMGGAVGVSSGVAFDNNATNNKVQDASGDVIVVNIAPGDFDEDLDVDFTDLFSKMIGTYYYNYQLNHTLYDERADFNLDGKIDFTDVFVYMVGMYYYGYWFYYPWL